MKKKIIIGLLMVSALSFGAGNNNLENMSKNNNKGFYNTQMMKNLSEKQQAELNKMMEDRAKVNYIKSLDMKSKELQLEKLLLEEKVNWKSVEKVNKEISGMKAKQRLESIKFKSNIEDKYEISMGHRGMMGNNRSTGEKQMKGGHMKNGQKEMNKDDYGNKDGQKGMNDNKRMNKNDEKGNHHTQMMKNLSEKQQKELTKMMEDRMEANYKKSLDMRSKELGLEKLLSQDKVDWKSVEKVNNEISDMKAEQRLEGMKFRSNIETKYGISMGHKGMMNSKMMGGQMGNGYRNN